MIEELQKLPNMVFIYNVLKNMEEKEKETGQEPSKELEEAIQGQYKLLADIMSEDPKEAIKNGGKSYIFNQTPYMFDQTLDGSRVLTSKMGTKTRHGGFLARTFIWNPTDSRVFAPELGAFSSLALESTGLGGEGSDSDDWGDETMLPCAQACCSLIDQTMGGRLVREEGYHDSLLSQTIDRPIHTNPEYIHCPGLHPGWHLLY